VSNLFIYRYFSTFIILLFLNFNSNADTRIKDIVDFEGIRDNVLVGYGLVVGLDGTGDNMQNSSFTKKGLVNLLEKLGINTRGENLRTKNIAAVMVTGTLPGFSRSGSRVNVNLSTLGDAKSLKGGTLLATPLIGVDGNIYAVAQGLVSIGRLSSTNDYKPILTSGYVTQGGVIEREIDFKLNDVEVVNIALKNQDLTTSRSIATAINSFLRGEYAKSLDPGTVALSVPNSYFNNVVGLLADIENITVEPQTIARIIIDEATGTIVIGENVKISKVAVAQNDLVVRVSPTELNVPDPTDYPNNNMKTRQYPKGTAFKVVSETANLSELVEVLNELGVKPKDLIAILRSIQQAGALQAVIEVQ
jgi:flagellar P-ring protein precursor FlgI